MEARELRRQLVVELGAVRERGILRVDSPNPDLRRLDLDILREVIPRWDPSRKSFVNRLLAAIKGAVDELPEGVARRAATRLFGLDADPTLVKPTVWRNEARKMYPLIGVDDWRKGIELELIGLVAGNLEAILGSRIQLDGQVARGDSGALVLASDIRYAVTSAFWAGNYSESATRSQTLLELAIRQNDLETAAHFLSNLILISRSRQRFSDVAYLMRRYFPAIGFRRLPSAYRLRLMKELFVYYYEIEDFRRSQLCLQRMEAIDSSLMTYTPLDDWMPGTIRWRKAHLDWICCPSKMALGNSIALAQEGVEYLAEVVQYNPNTAGLASAKLNVGWLYFLDNNPICLDYFEEATSLAMAYSPRTRIEADIAKSIGAAKFRLQSPESSLSEVALLKNELLTKGYPLRSYAFVADDSEWSAIGRALGLLQPGKQNKSRRLAG